MQQIRTCHAHTKQVLAEARLWSRYETATGLIISFMFESVPDIGVFALVCLSLPVSHFSVARQIDGNSTTNVHK